MRCLPDVNILIALLDGNHVFHTRVHGWLAPHKGGLATCAITQNGAIRVMSQPRYSSVISLSAAQVKQQLQMGLARQDHAYWPCNETLMDDGLFDWSRIHGHAQLTDIYLLGLAVRRKGVLVTFDRRIPIAAVKGASKAHVETLEPSD